MRVRTFLKGEALQGCVIRFCDDFRDAGIKKAVKFDGEFLRLTKTDNATQLESLVGVYDPKSASFDFERMVSDVLAAMEEMGVCVEQEKA